jgi:hypothetical protein
VLLRPLGNLRSMTEVAIFAEAIDTLVASGALTSLGMRFVEGMRATVEPWLDEPVPPGAVEAAH